MEITESSSVPLETQNSHTISQDTKNLSKSAHDVVVSTVDKEQIIPVNESNTQNVLKNIKVYKRMTKLQCVTETNKQLKKTYKPQKFENVKTRKHLKSKKEKYQQSPKTVNSNKECNGNKSSKVGTIHEAGQNAFELNISKQQKSSKLLTAKKSPSEGNKEKFISKNSKKLLLSDYVTLSRDWTANRKTYTRNATPISVRSAENYDCLTQKSGETNSECTTESTTVSVETDVTDKNDNTLPTDQLLTNDRIDNSEIDMPMHNKEDSYILNDTRGVLRESKTNSLQESSDLQRTVKTTILKQKNSKSKRKSVHFSDKIDLPGDSLNRNDIILEIADLITKNQDESVDHLSDVSANDAVNASIEIDKIQCPIKEQPKHKTYTKIVQKKNNKNSRQDASKTDIVRRKRGRPRKVDVINKDENAILKAKVLPKNKITKLQDKKISPMFKTVANLQHGGKSLLSSRSVRKRGRQRKIVDSKLSVSVKQYQRNGKNKANFHIKRDRIQSTIATTTTTAETISSQQFMKRKRGRPRKYPLENSSNYDVNSPAAKRIKLDSLNTTISSTEEPLVVDASTVSMETPAEQNVSRIATESITNKENVVDGVPASNNVTTEQQETGQKIGNSDETSKILVLDNCTDNDNLEKSEKISLKANSDKNEIKVQHITQEACTLEICDENVSNAQINKNKEQNVQNIKKSTSNICEVLSEHHSRKKQEIQQRQEINNLAANEVLIYSETDEFVNEINTGKVYRILKSNLPCSDLDLVKSKRTEQEIQNLKKHYLEVSESITDSNETAIENKGKQYETYKQQRLKYQDIETEASSNAKISENQHSEQKIHKRQSVKKPDLQALSELSNHDTNAIGSETKRQKICRKNKKTTRFKVSELICDNIRVNNETGAQRKYKRKSKRIVNVMKKLKHKRKCKRTTSVVKKLLKKTDSIAKKTKRKKKINTSKLGASQNFSAADEKQTFCCGVCKQVCNKFREINHHIMLRHNGLARINDDTPFSSEEEISAFNQTLKTIRHLQCLQPDCGKKFISVLGYKYHRENCGVNAPKINCEICGKAFKSGSLANHMRVSHAPRPDVVEEPILEELPRRGAAVKALKKMENFIKTQKFCLEEENELDEEYSELDDDSIKDSDYQESDFSEEDNDDYYEDPEFFFTQMLDPWKESIKTPADKVEEIIRKMSEVWEQTLAETGKLKCDRKSCDKEFSSTLEMKSHLEHCNARKWICKVCRITYSQGLSLYNHMKREHCVEEETVNDTDEAGKKSNYSHINNLLNTSFDPAGRRRLLTPYLPALEWSVEFRKKHHKNELFSQWKPHAMNWVQMKKRNSTDYLPPLKESACIKHPEENSSVWMRLGLFECPEWADKQRQKTFFVGGSVWGSAWCPTGTNSKAVQFLALAANNPAPHPLTDCSNRKGLIQLWDMGILETNRSSSTPNLTLAIAHENGSVWDMEWCPSGCWEEASDVQIEKKPSDILPRLGLLAVACSNSTVRIYSIPHPHSIIKTKDSLPIFRCRPAVVLVCPESAPNISCHRTLCTKVSWQRTNGHSCLAAGFGNGMVCLWNLMSSSPLLTVSQFGGQITLRPYLSFPAHGACIMGLVWVPASGGQYLSTAGYDRCVKVWNLQEYNWPSLVTKRGLITDIAWLPYWCGVFASLDDCYNLHHTATFYKECGHCSFAPKALSAHFGCTWSLSVSDWLNAEASGDAGGEVIITILCQLMKLVDSIKLMSRRRVPLFRINMEPLNYADEGEKQTDSVQQNGCENNEESTCLVGSKETGEKSVHHTNQKDYSEPNMDIMSYSLYEEAVKKVGLVLHDNNMEDFSSIPEKEFRRVRQPETMSSYAPDQYPLNSINKVSWNPNLGSHLWLFSAGQAGIARICCVYGLQSDKLRNTVNKCKEKFKVAADGL